MTDPHAMHSDQSSQLADLSARVARLEAQVAALSQQLGYAAPYGSPARPQAGNVQVSAAVYDLVERNKPIAAIKQLRKETGLSLADAKNVVDQLRK